MTITEFNEAVKAVAAGRYCSVEVDVSNYADGKVRVTWKAYIEDVGFREGITPDMCLASLAVPLDTEIPVVGPIGEAP